MLQKHVYSIHFMATLHKVLNWNVPESKFEVLKNNCTVEEESLIGTVWLIGFISDAFYAESFMLHKMLHSPAHSSLSFQLWSSSKTTSGRASDFLSTTVSKMTPAWNQLTKSSGSSPLLIRCRHRQVAYKTSHHL